MIVGVPTYERPNILRKALLPYLREGTRVRVYDSSKLSTCNENKELLRSLEREFRTKILYASRRELLTFVKHLAKQGVDPEVSSYALGEGSGSARNRILLDTQGDKIVMADDDVVAKLKLYGSQDEVAFRKAFVGLRANPESYTNYDSIEQAFSHVEDLPLGTEVGALGNFLGERVESLWKGSDRMVMGVRGRGRVAAVQVGCVGDPPGTAWSEFDTIRGGTSALQSRSGKGWVRGVKYLTYQPAGFIRTFFLGLDNRTELPPFYPSETPSGGLLGESVYGSLLALSKVHSVFLPEVVSHRPERVKTRRSEIELPGEVVLAEAAMSVSSLVELSDLLEEATQDWADSMAVRAENRIKEDLDRRMTKLEKGLIKAGKVSRTTVKVRRPDPEQVQDILDFGKLLKAWPSLLEASSILRGNGVSLTTEL